MNNPSILIQVLQSFVADHNDYKINVVNDASAELHLPMQKGKLKFIMAKLGEEVKIGFAYFEDQEQQPDWIDDVEVINFSADLLSQILTNIEEQEDY
jgi:hypothetical protein